METKKEKIKFKKKQISSVEKLYFWILYLRKNLSTHLLYWNQMLISMHYTEIMVFIYLNLITY